MERLVEVTAGYGLDSNGYNWTERVITDESVLAVIEMRYKIQIA